MLEEDLEGEEIERSYLRVVLDEDVIVYGNDFRDVIIMFGRKYFRKRKARGKVALRKKFIFFKREVGVFDDILEDYFYK